MKRFFLILTTATLALAAGLTPAGAADLGALPKTLAQIMPAAVPDQWRSCYAEAGVTGKFARHTDPHGIVGIGCDYRVPESNIVVGALARFGYDVQSHSSRAVTINLDDALTFAARAGYLVQPSLLVYALGCIKADRNGHNDLCLGAGVERVIYNTLSINLEYQSDIIDRKLDNHTAILSLKHRF